MAFIVVVQNSHVKEGGTLHLAHCLLEVGIYRSQDGDSFNLGKSVTFRHFFHLFGALIRLVERTNFEICLSYRILCPRAANLLCRGVVHHAPDVIRQIIETHFLWGDLNFPILKEENGEIPWQNYKEDSYPRR